MKKQLLLLSLITVLYLAANAQYTQPTTVNTNDAAFSSSLLLKGKLFTTPELQTAPVKDHDFYLRRSKNYRIVGWSTLGAGLVLSGIGLLEASNGSGSTTAATLTIAGALSGIVSIPFMIMASANKHKARLMLDSKKTGFGVPANISKDITGITMILPIGK